jgi:transcriptional regulator with XRE-family HTH domain
MDDRKVGLIIRALRRRRGWRQIDLARRADVPQSVVSEIERGHLDAKQVRTVRRLLNALDADVRLEVRWRGGEADRLIDEDHARLGGTVAQRLERLGWTVRTEVTYSEYGERGSFDILGWRAETGDLVVIEVKTELLSAEATLRKMDEKVRLAPKVVGERFGWRPRLISRVLVLRASSVNRRRLRSHAGIFDAAIPDDPVLVRRWLADPRTQAGLDGRWFVPLIAWSSDGSTGGGRHRVRCHRRAA